MTIQTIDRATAKQLASGTEAALKSYAESLGLDVAVTGGSFDQGMYRPRVTFTVKQTATGLSSKEDTFRRNATFVGLAPDDYGKTFNFSGKSFTITGLLIARKKPVLATNINGKEFLFSAFDVKRLLTT